MARGKVGAGVQKLKGIKCKAKRIEVFQKLKKEGDTQNRKDRKKRQKDTEALGDDAPDLKLQQKTLDNTREVDETIVGPDDPDIAAEDSFDEFSGHFLQQLQPRTIVTTSMNPSKFIEEFLAEMVEMLPNSEYRKRSKCGVKDMCDAAVKRGATARSNKRPRELAVPELGSCASSRRAGSSGRLDAPWKRGWATGRPTRCLGCSLAASQVADSTALFCGRPGFTNLLIFTEDNTKKSVVRRSRSACESTHTSLPPLLP